MGADAQVRWLLQRGYQLMVKGFSNRRAYALAQQVKRWDSYAQDQQLGEVAAPLDFGRKVRVFVKRRRKAGQWLHSYYLSTLQLPSKRHFLTSYQNRGDAEVAQFREDKQGLYLAARRKRSFLGQRGYLILTDLTHNLLAELRLGVLADSPFADYGLKRIVRDLLHVPGRLYFEGHQLRRIELLSLNQNSDELLKCLERFYFSG